MYTLNKNYVPKQGDYLSSEDWTDDQIKWLANNTPESWWCSPYVRKETGFNGYGYLQWYNEHFVTSIVFPSNNMRITPDMVLLPSGITVCCNLNFYKDYLAWLDNFSSPLLQPSPRSKKVLVADLGNDTMDTLTDRLTHGKVYNKISKPSGRSVEVLCDDGIQRAIGSCWFKEVYLYDEDETELTCRDIEFKEDDYIDLRKHTPDQIRHIAKFYKFFDVEDLFNNMYRYNYAVFTEDGEFEGYTDASYECSGKEYTYDDIFYKEGI